MRPWNNVAYVALIHLQHMALCKCVLTGGLINRLIVAYVTIAF